MHSSPPPCSPCSQAMPSTYKPSPLSFGSPRTSPFRRPESPKPSPSSPASTIRPSTPTSSTRPTTPTPSPTKPHTPLQSPSKLNTVATPTFTDDEEDDEEDSRTVRNFAPSLTQRGSFTLSTSPSRNSTPVANKPGLMNRMALGGDALARLHPAQVREMREGFQILDRDNDGLVNREDVVDMLTNLGNPPRLLHFTRGSRESERKRDRRESARLMMRTNQARTLPRRLYPSFSLPARRKPLPCPYFSTTYPHFSAPSPPSRSLRMRLPLSTKMIVARSMRKNYGTPCFTRVRSRASEQ